VIIKVPKRQAVVERYSAILNIEGGSALSSCQAVISATLRALFCYVNYGSYSAYSRPRSGCSRGNAFWIIHTGTWEFCVIKVEVMQELARPNSCIQSTRMVFWGMRVKKGHSLPLYQIDKLKKSYIFFRIKYSYIICV
jgi:hypothetical protein